MADRLFIKPTFLIPSPAASPANTGSMGANITSAPFVIQLVSMFSLEVTWAGTSPVGVLNVQASNSYSLDAVGNVKNAGIWTNMTVNVGGSPVVDFAISGASGSIFIDIGQTSAYAIRCVYTRTSGTGTMSVLLVGKDT